MATDPVVFDAVVDDLFEQAHSLCSLGCCAARSTEWPGPNTVYVGVLSHRVLGETAAAMRNMS